MTDQNPDREKLAEMIRLHMDGGESDPDLDVLESDYCCADAILASEWMREHDERVETLYEQREWPERLREHDVRVRREAAAEQREKDAQIAEDIASGYWTRKVADYWTRKVAAAIREQGAE